MKKIITIVFLFGFILLTACSQGTNSTTTNWVESDWVTVENEAQNSEVRIFMWGGDPGINRYIDDWVAPHLKERYDITLTRHPMDTADFIAKLQTEKQAKKSKGTMDIIWINGENFKKAKENDLLFGSFSSKLPNLQTYIGNEQSYVQSDMGTSVEGLEAPWGKVQFVLFYDETIVKTPPKSFEELYKWAEENPGEFTYPNVKDFTGNAFVRHLLYDLASNNDEIADGFNEEWLNVHSKEVWQTLNKFESVLWREGKTYPESLEKLDQLYAKGEVAFTMGFNERRVDSLIKDGIFPDTTRALVLEPGSIGNTHYLSIPFNSPNPTGAMTVINFMLSPAAQIAKLDPNMWGEGMSIDPAKLSAEELEQVKEFGGEPTVLSEDVLVELDARYADWIKEHWENEVVKE